MSFENTEAYTFDDLWAAVQVLNPKQPIETDKNHILSMLIPNIIAYTHARYSNDMNYEIEEHEWDALELLTLAYWHLSNDGVYHLKEQEI